ncbi:hypothetical protein H257_03381 [Aphanomyces astaci]|uniref:Uncharacterized protein n=1 Tax=Aphanomyces astaci TaxID=112090 RepID=W4GWG4_APHAT|nr:hypothetical protein H257_03381 [Aphanomyces astaci]ETV84022.1 hypothetical protein H257_03381 [Aphanomyces astaci]|eukprot:XP_009825714.1 hypothetical protein H257_03381 [Aphanomyces astaci]
MRWTSVSIDVVATASEVVRSHELQEHYAIAREGLSCPCAFVVVHQGSVTMPLTLAGASGDLDAPIKWRISDKTEPRKDSKSVVVAEKSVDACSWSLILDDK